LEIMKIKEKIYAYKIAKTLWRTPLKPLIKFHLVSWTKKVSKKKNLCNDRIFLSLKIILSFTKNRSSKFDGTTL
jgi:hypothetical protein